MIRSKNILFCLGYISHTHYPAFRYPFMNAMPCSGRHESLWHAAACVTRTLHFSAHGRARALSYLKAHLKAHTWYIDRNREKEWKDVRIDRRSNSHSWCICHHQRSLDNDFMAIRNDAHKGWHVGKKPSSRLQGTIAKNGIRHEQEISRNLRYRLSQTERSR